jgi:hypothetical protein
MEFGLNLFWLLLAAASFALWRREPGVRPRGRAGASARSAITLACALAVLFPVISLTDDLHGEQAAVEDSSARTLKKWAGAEASSDAGNSPHLPACLAAPFDSSCPPRCFGEVVSLDLVLRKTAELCFVKGRAPPGSPSSPLTAI